MYTIPEYQNNSTGEEIPRIKVYENLKKHLLQAISIIVCTLIVIIVQGFYPAPIMDLLEKVGVIEYTEAINARIQMSKGSYRGREKTYYNLVGNYYDKSNKLHNVDISLMFADLEYLDSSYLYRNNNKCPIAYYSFYPDYDILRIPASFSLFAAYSFLSGGFIYLIYILYRRRKIFSLLSDFSIGKLVRPVMFRRKKVLKRGGYNYTFFVIWETPNGNRLELSPTQAKEQPIQVAKFNREKWDEPIRKSQQDELASLDFLEEYCGIYLANSKGEELIIQPKDVEYVKTKFGYKTNDFDVFISQTSRRIIGQRDGGESNQNSRLRYKNDRNNRHGHDGNK